MKILNQFMSLILSISLLTQGIPFAYAQSTVEEETLGSNEDMNAEDKCSKEPVNGTCCSLMKLEGDSCVTKDLKDENGCSTKPVNGACCSSMEVDGDSCVVRVPDVSFLNGCNSAGACAAGQGCLPLTSKDIFSDIQDDNVRLSNQLEYEPFLSNGTNGSSCKTNLDCASFNCVAKTGLMTTGSVCKEKMVCRKLHEGEALTGGVQCGLGLEAENGVCVQKYESVPVVGEYDDQGKDVFKVFKDQYCEIQFDEELKLAGLIAIRAIRGMEWYFATMNDNTKECTGAPKELKKTGMELQKARKPLVEQLSVRLNNIEDDFKKLMAASWKYSNPDVVSGKTEVESKDVQIHQDTNLSVREKTISDQDLATRQSSGYDTLLMMQRRNAAFMEYEVGMLGVLGQFADKIKSGGEKAEKLGTCTGGKPQYKVRPFIKWKTKDWKGMEMWHMQYDVAGASGNSSIAKKKEVGEALSLISGEKVSEGTSESELPVPKTFTGHHYLIDPIPFAGMKISGPSKGLKKKGGFLGLPIFGGFKDLRSAAYIPGSDSFSYKAMYEPLQSKLLEFYKEMRPSDPKFRYIYEPELQTPDYKFAKDEKGYVIKRPIVLGRNCIEDPNQVQYRLVRSGDKPQYPVVEIQLTEDLRESVDNLSSYEFDHFMKNNVKIEVQKIDVCADFRNFVKSVQGEGFAQFLAYGHSPTDAYNLTSKENFRRKLFAKLMVDFTNLKTYYENLVKVREEQSACIERVMEKLGEFGILDSSESGITPGASTNYDSNSAKTASFLTNDKRVKTKLNKFKRTAFNPQFRFGNLKSISDRTNMDNMGEFGNLGGSGSFSGADGSSFAILKDKFKKANEKAKAEGTDVEGKNKDYKKLVSSLYKNGAGQGGLGNGQSGLGRLGAPNLGGAKLGSDLKSAGSSGPTGEGHNGLRGESTAGVAAGSQGGMNSGSAGGYGSNSGYGSGSGDGSSSADTGDASGLSDAQKKAMFDEYERNKKDYQGNEDDTLFKTVSKAYVRNLDKILKKKKVEDNP
jgi:hypothetical protein